MPTAVNEVSKKNRLNNNYIKDIQTLNTNVA